MVPIYQKSMRNRSKTMRVFIEWTLFRNNSSILWTRVTVVVKSILVKLKKMDSRKKKYHLKATPWNKLNKIKSSLCWKINFSAEARPRNSRSTKNNHLCRKNPKRKVSSRKTTNTFLRNSMTMKRRKSIAVSWVCWVYWAKELSGSIIGPTNLPGGKVRS